MANVVNIFHSTNTHLTYIHCILISMFLCLSENHTGVSMNCKLFDIIYSHISFIPEVFYSFQSKNPFGGEKYREGIRVGDTLNISNIATKILQTL